MTPSYLWLVHEVDQVSVGGDNSAPWPIPCKNYPQGLKDEFSLTANNLQLTPRIYKRNRRTGRCAKARRKRKFPVKTKEAATKTLCSVIFSVAFPAFRFALDDDVHPYFLLRFPSRRACGCITHCSSYSCCIACFRRIEGGHVAVLNTSESTVDTD